MRQRVRGQSHSSSGRPVLIFAVWRPADKRLTRDIVKAFQFAEKAARQVTQRQQITVEIGSA